MLYSFYHLTNCSDGQDPFAGLILGAAGNLYGLTGMGGAFGGGTVFKLTPNSDDTGQKLSCLARRQIQRQRPCGGIVFDYTGKGNPCGYDRDRRMA